MRKHLDRKEPEQHSEELPRKPPQSVSPSQHSSSSLQAGSHHHQPFSGSKQSSPPLSWEWSSWKLWPRPAERPQRWGREPKFGLGLLMDERHWRGSLTKSGKWKRRGRREAILPARPCASKWTTGRSRRWSLPLLASRWTPLYRSPIWCDTRGKAGQTECSRSLCRCRTELRQSLSQPGFQMRPLFLFHFDPHHYFLFFFLILPMPWSCCVSVRLACVLHFVAHHETTQTSVTGICWMLI